MFITNLVGNITDAIIGLLQKALSPGYLELDLVFFGRDSKYLSELFVAVRPTSRVAQIPSSKNILT